MLTVPFFPIAEPHAADACPGVDTPGWLAVLSYLPLGGCFAPPSYIFIDIRRADPASAP
jgi:hypothetical protein